MNETPRTDAEIERILAKSDFDITDAGKAAGVTKHSFVSIPATDLALFAAGSPWTSVQLTKYIADIAIRALPIED